MSCSMDIPSPDRPLTPPSPPEPAPAAPANSPVDDEPPAMDTDLPLVIDLGPDPTTGSKDPAAAAAAKTTAAEEEENLCPLCFQSLSLLKRENPSEPGRPVVCDRLFLRHRGNEQCRDMHLDCVKKTVQTYRMEDKMPLLCPVCHVELNNHDFKKLLPPRRKLIMESFVQPMDELSEYQMVLLEFYRPTVLNPTAGGSNPEPPNCRKVWTFNYKSSNVPGDQKIYVPSELFTHPQVSRLVPQVIQQHQIEINGQPQQQQPPTQIRLTLTAAAAKPQSCPIPAAAAAAVVPVPRPSCSTLPQPDEMNPSPLRMVLRQENQVKKAMIDLYREFYRFKQQQILEKGGFNPRRKPGTRISDTVAVRAGFKRKVFILKKMDDRMQSMKKNLLDFNSDFLDLMLSSNTEMLE